MNRAVWTRNDEFESQGLKVTHGQNNYYVIKSYREKGPDGKKKTVSQVVGLVIPGGKIPFLAFSQAISAPLKEYGFSQACLELLPLKWKNNLGDDWFNIFMTIVLDVSKNSFLGDFPYQAYRHRNLGAHRASMEAYLGMRLTDLYEIFGSIMIALQNGECIYRSQTTPEQSETARRLGITLGGYLG